MARIFSSVLMRIAGLLLLVTTATVAQLSEQVQGPTHFLVAHGRWAWASGYENAGLEIWAGALQLATDVHPEFRREGDVTTLSGPQLVSSVRVEPWHFERTYVGPDFSVTEDVFAPLNQPAIRIHYMVISPHSLQIIVRFRPSVNLMWPAALGGQHISWESKHSGYWISDGTGEFGAVVVAPGAVAHDQPRNDVRASDAEELSIALSPQSPEIAFVRTDPDAQLGLSFTQATKDLDSSGLEREAQKHYRDVMNSELGIETPDEEVNRALAWAEVALDQAWFCNEKLGCSYVAGFGPSRKHRRPQYAWYFAGDGIIAGESALAIGDLEHARDEIRFIAKYQDAATGMIWHELSQSAPYIDWRGKYPYMFVHSDITATYVSTVADYVRASNDHTFLREIWPSVQKAFEYARRLVAADGLPHIPEGKEGVNEQHPLGDELALSVSWVKACDDYAHLATVMSQESFAAEASSFAEKARAVIATRYWNAEKNFPIEGHDRNGSPVEDRGLGGLSAVRQHLFAENQSAHVLDQIATARYQTDWGTRSVPEGEPGYNPTAYANGSVWAIGTANVAETYWEEHRPEIAWQLWRTLIPWSTLDSPGHMDEVMSGDIYHPQYESVPEQSWSSASFLSSAVHGLLGLHLDAETGTITFAPHLPANWDHVQIRDLRLNASALTFDLHQSRDGSDLHTENNGKPVQIVFRPRIPFGVRTLRALVDGKHVGVRLQNEPGDEHASLEFIAPHGRSEVSLRYTGGVSVVFPAPHPSLANPSTAMKPTGIAFSGKTLTVSIDTMSPLENSFELLTSRPIETVTGANLRNESGDTYLLTVSADKKAVNYSYQHHQITVKFAK